MNWYLPSSVKQALDSITLILCYILLSKITSGNGVNPSEWCFLKIGVEPVRSVWSQLCKNPIGIMLRKLTHTVQDILLAHRKGISHLCRQGARYGPPCSCSSSRSVWLTLSCNGIFNPPRAQDKRMPRECHQEDLSVCELSVYLQMMNGSSAGGVHFQNFRNFRVWIAFKMSEREVNTSASTEEEYPRCTTIPSTILFCLTRYIHSC